MTAAVEVLPATGDRFDLVEHALTGGGDGASCWCRWLLETRRAFDAATRDERRALLLHELQEAPVAPGLVLTVYTPEPGTPSADALTLLATWATTHLDDTAAATTDEPSTHQQ